MGTFTKRENAAKEDNLQKTVDFLNACHAFVNDPAIEALRKEYAADKVPALITAWETDKANGWFSPHSIDFKYNFGADKFAYEINHLFEIIPDTA